MLFPALVILPGMIAIALLHRAAATAFSCRRPRTARPITTWSVPAMLAQYFPNGMLGIGLTALMASFMSGMAGNVTAFNTVWTYDIYQSYIRPGSAMMHYLVRWAA